MRGRLTRAIAEELFGEARRADNVAKLGREVLGGAPLEVVDFGAAWGLPQPLMRIAGDVDAVGFDPDPDECETLNKRAEAAGLAQRFFPFAIAGSEATRPFYVLRKSASSSLFEPNLEWHRRFPRPERAEVVETIEIRTRRASSVLQELELSPEFIKLDVHGVEEEVLRSLTVEQWSTALAVHVELLLAPQYLGLPPVGAIHDLLREQRFELYDLHRWTSRRASFDVDRRETRGQIAHVDALYLREPASLDARGRQRLAVVAACFDHFDVAAELVEPRLVGLVHAAAARPRRAVLTFGGLLLRAGGLGQRIVRAPRQHFGDDYRPEWT